MTVIDGVDLHLLHVRSPHQGALALVMTHGWPGSVIELLEVVGPPDRPDRYGGGASDAFDLVLPSLPGYGLSGEPAWSAGSCVPSCCGRAGPDEPAGRRRRLIGGQDAGSRRAERRGPGPSARRDPRPHDPRTGRSAPAPSTFRPVNSDHIRALRHARELVADMRWRGLTVPPLYDHMAGEFQDLIDSGDYAKWVATGTAAAPPDRAGSVPSGSWELVSEADPASARLPTWRSGAAGSPRSWPR